MFIKFYHKKFILILFLIYKKYIYFYLHKIIIIPFIRFFIFKIIHYFFLLTYLFKRVMKMICFTIF